MAYSNTCFQVIQTPYRFLNSSYSAALVRSKSLNHPPFKAASFSTCKSFVFSGGCKTLLRKPVQTAGKKVKFYTSLDGHNADDDEFDIDDVLESEGLDLDPLFPLFDADDYDAFQEKVSLICENGLIRFRVLLLIDLLLRVSRTPQVRKIACLDKYVKTRLSVVLHEFAEVDAVEIKKIQEDQSRRFDHVQAAQQFLRGRCSWDPNLSKIFEIFDSSSTDGDINYVALAFMARMAVKQFILPAMNNFIDVTNELAEEIFRMSVEVSGVEGLEEEGKKQTLRIKMYGEDLEKQCEVFLDKKDEVVRTLIQNNEWLTSKKVEIVHMLSTAAEASTPWAKMLGQSDGNCDEQECLDKIFYSIVCFNSILIDFVEEMMRNVSSFDFLDGELSVVDLRNSKVVLGEANAVLKELKRMLNLGIEYRRGISTNSTFLTSMGMGLFCSFFAYKDVVKGIRKLGIKGANPTLKTKRLRDADEEFMHGLMQISDQVNDFTTILRR